MSGGCAATCRRWPPGRRPRPPDARRRTAGHRCRRNARPGAKPGKAAKEPKPPRKRRRKGPILLVLLLVLAIAAGGTGWWFGSGRYTPVPSVLNQDQPTAEAALATADLKAAVAESVYSEDVPAGLVISTDPEPTVDARRGSTGAS